MSENQAQPADAPAHAANNQWRELARRLYVELFHCDQQMMSARDEGGEPIWDQGISVSNVLADARASLEATPSDEAPTESVLIDGTAYAVSAPVAAELLRLHLELKAGDNPVGGQSRFGSDHWGACTVEHVLMVQKDPSYAANGYEARLIYARPAAAPPPRPEVNILAEVERHAKAHIKEIENLLSRRF